MDSSQVEQNTAASRRKVENITHYPAKNTGRFPTSHLNGFQARVCISPDITAHSTSFREQLSNERPDESKRINWAVFDVPLELSAKNTSIDGKGLSNPKSSSF